MSSQCETASRKLATITVSATERREAGDDAGDGDGGAVALVARALDREQGERRGAAARTAASSSATPPGTQAMPPISRQATEA